MVAPRIRFSTEILVYTLYTSIYVVCGPEIYGFFTTLLIGHSLGSLLEQGSSAAVEGSHVHVLLPLLPLLHGLLECS